MPIVAVSLDGKESPVNPEDFTDVNPTGFTDIVTPFFRQNNVIGSTIDSVINQDSSTQYLGVATTFSELDKQANSSKTGMDYYNKALAKGVPPTYADNFFNVRDEQEFSLLENKVQRQIKDKSLIARAGGGTQLMAGAISGALDFDSFIPFMGALKYVKTANKTLNIAKGAASVALPASVANLTSETILTNQKEGRSNQTGFFADNNYIDALIGGAVFGGIIGGGIGALRQSHGNMNQFQENLGREINNPDVLFDNISTFGTSSASAAQTRQTTLADEGIAGGAVVQALAQTIDKPILDKKFINAQEEVNGFIIGADDTPVNNAINKVKKTYC